MKTRTLELSVGIFVLLGVVSLLMLAIQVSGLSNFYHKETGYVIKASFENIGGLKVRAKVTIGGVTVGRVEKIELESGEGEYEPMVYMLIDSKVKDIPKDSAAKILTAGLLGDNFVGIELGNDSEVLKAGDVIALTTQAMMLEDLISKFAVGGTTK